MSRAPLTATLPAPALAPLALVPLALAAGCAQAPADGGPTPAPTASSAVTAASTPSTTAAPAPEELVPVLGEPATEEDALPTIEGRPVDEGLAAGSARRLGATERAEYWVALDDEGGVCLLLALAPGDDAVSRSCGPADVLARRGTWVMTWSQTQSATGLLVPEGFDLDDASRDEDWVLVADHLAVPADEAG